MLLGPVFEFELAIAPRKGRFYALRFAYGMALLALLAASYRKAFGTDLAAATASLPQVARFARALFQDVLLMQAGMVIFLTPALVAGAIAGEVQRKTLHDLLASDLTSLEIVLGKLSARLLNVGVLVASGLPVLVFTGVLGGIDLRVAAGTAAATLSTAFFLAALSILASTQTRSTRGALNFTFTLALTWLILPGAADVLIPRGGDLGLQLYDWIGPINAWIAPSTPFGLWLDYLRGAIRAPEAALGRIAWMVGLQSGYGAIMAALAVACLRPTYRAREGGTRRRTSAVPSEGRARPARRRPSCGDDPMLWKELLAPRAPAFYLPLGLIVSVALGGLLVWTTIDFAAPAFRELAAEGYGVAASGSSRAQFHFYLRIVGTGIVLVYLLGVASDSAASMTSEREKDTWISLVTTPLTGREIVRAKMLGAVWGIRHTAAVLILLWLTGTLAGAVHPLGFVAVLVELAAFTWFTTALGTWASLRSGSTMQSLARVLACLVFLNGGYLLLALPLSAGRPLAYLASSPLLLAASLVSYGDVRGQMSQSLLGTFSDSAFAALWVRQGGEAALACLAGVLAYSAAAWALTLDACRRFDAQLDRPPVLAPDAADQAPSGLPSRPRPHASTSTSARRPGLRRRTQDATTRMTTPAANPPG